MVASSVIFALQCEKGGIEVSKYRLAVCVVAYLISMSTACISAYHRIPWSDEGWFSSAAYNLAYKGHMGTTVIEPTMMGLTRIEEHTYWIMPLYPLGQGLWYMVFPHTMLSTRGFTILWQPLMGLALGFLLSKLFPGRAVSWLGAFLLAFSFVFMDNAGFARPDLMCATLGWFGLASYLYWRETNRHRAIFVANLLVAASGLTHPNGIFHFVALIAMVLVLDRRVLSWTHLAIGASAYALMGSLYGLYVMKDPVAFVEQMRANSASGRWPANWNPVWLVWSEIRERYLVVFGLITGGMALLKSYALIWYVASLVGCLALAGLRREKAVRLLLTLLLVYFSAMCIFNQKLSYYLIHILPAWVALMAVFVDWLWEHQRRWRIPLILALAALCVVETSGIVVRAFTRSYVASEKAVVDAIRRNSTADMLIAGTGSLSYGLDFDPRLIDDPFLGIRSGRVPDMVIIEPLYRMLHTAWITERPEEYAQLQARLQKYRKIYRGGDYEIYLLEK
jgi:hypothetical protein